MTKIGKSQPWCGKVDVDHRTEDGLRQLPVNVSAGARLSPRDAPTSTYRASRVSHKSTTARAIRVMPPLKRKSAWRPFGRRTATRVDRMARKLLTKTGGAAYAARKGIVEPVIGQIKQARGFRQLRAICSMNSASGRRVDPRICTRREAKSMTKTV